MTRAELMALADRVEAEPARPYLWEIAWHALLKPTAEHNIRRLRFVGLARAGAYIDAADMLRPGHMTIIDSSSTPTSTHLFRIYNWDGDLSAEGSATGPDAEARARLAANLRAHAAEVGDG